jgi:hypothetical protein
VTANEVAGSLAAQIALGLVLEAAQQVDPCLLVRPEAVVAQPSPDLALCLGAVVEPELVREDIKDI